MKAKRPTKPLTERQKKALKAMGGRETTVQEFLGLSDEDMAVIEARLALREAIRKGRSEAGLTQAELAKRIGTSQARVARMEGGDPQTSLESMMRALAATGYRARVTISRKKAA
jgi:ribosome-binding protein aMBF1 (putative translation factor)